MKPQIVNAKINMLPFKAAAVKMASFAGSVLCVALLMGNLYYSDRVYITDGDETQKVTASTSDAYSILESEGYTLGSSDHVSYVRDDNKTAHIIIHRAFDVDVIVDGEVITVTTISASVEDVLARAGVTLGEYDEISLPLYQKLEDSAEITVNRVKYETTQITEEIPFETVYVDNSNLVIGTERILTEGANGSRTYTVKERYVNGELASTTEDEEAVVIEPVAAVVERGTALADPYSKTDFSVELVNGRPVNYTKVLSGKSTAYTAYDGAGTASGRPATIGTCAVNPNVIPYGTELYIVASDGSRVYGYAIAADTGSVLMESDEWIADLYFGSAAEHYQDSCNWGVVFVDVYFLS